MGKSKEKKWFFEVEDGVVKQKQPYSGEGYVEGPAFVTPGYLYDGENFTAPEPTPLSWDNIREIRNQLISKTDWTQLADSPLTETEKAAWVIYREELRDITESFNSPSEVIWPEAPDA